MSHDATQSMPTLPSSIDPQLHGMVIAAIKEQPVARLLAESDLWQLGILAIDQGKINDPQWLHAAIKDLEEASPLIPGSKIPKIPVSAAPKKPNEDQLTAILAQHELWRDSVLHPSKRVEAGRANFENSDLRGIKVVDRDLRGANFRSAILDGSSFINCNLATCCLESSSLKSCHWQNVTLRSTNMRHSNLSESLFSDVDFRNADLTGVNWSATRIEGSIKGGELLPDLLLTSSD